MLGESHSLAAKNFPGTKNIMTNLRIVLLATTALTVTQFAVSASHAQTAPLVVAQAKEDVGPDGKPRQPPPAAPACTPCPAGSSTAASNTASGRGSAATPGTA